MPGAIPRVGFQGKEHESEDPQRGRRQKHFPDSFCLSSRLFTRARDHLGICWLQSTVDFSFLWNRVTQCNSPSAPLPTVQHCPAGVRVKVWFSPLSAVRFRHCLFLGVLASTGPASTLGVRWTGLEGRFAGGGEVWLCLEGGTEA